MIRIIDVPQTHTLTEYASYNHLNYVVEDLRSVAHTGGPLKGRTVWMVNSTEKGGGVAEMLPKLVLLLRELGIKTEWVVVGSDDERFFSLTKRIHNLLHGVGTPNLDEGDQAFYESVSLELAQELGGLVGRDDLLVVHDPQPLAAGALVKRQLGVPAVWRCHIGLDRQVPATKNAWDFLRPWAEAYNRVVFTVADYVPDFLEDRATIIPPAIDPLNHKNRDLDPHELTGILVGSRLTDTDHPTPAPALGKPAQRLQCDGSFAPATEPEDIGLLFRPIVSQVSRWDKLKGFGPLLEGFARLKQGAPWNGRTVPQRHRQLVAATRLALIGPDPASIQDDPEGLETFSSISRQWHALPDELRRDVAILVLPMESRDANALMVNALQHCSTIVVQNSLREGFGLTVTEAMWKRRPVLGTHAVGIREQIADGVNGRLIDNPEDPDEIARALDEMLAHPEHCEQWARNAQLKVSREYLVFRQVSRWLNLLAGCC